MKTNDKTDLTWYLMVAAGLIALGGLTEIAILVGICAVVINI